jgi:hypothetical protein
LKRCSIPSVCISAPSSTSRILIFGLLIIYNNSWYFVSLVYFFLYFCLHVMILWSYFQLLTLFLLLDLLVLSYCMLLFHWFVDLSIANMFKNLNFLTKFIIHVVYFLI